MRDGSVLWIEHHHERRRRKWTDAVAIYKRGFDHAAVSDDEDVFIFIFFGDVV
jgi:hypothetical protein